MNNPPLPSTRHLGAYFGLQEVWRCRSLFQILVKRDLKIKYQRSSIGFIWTLLTPLCTSLILIAVFTYIIKVPIDDYWAFLLSGYFVWNFMHLVLIQSTNVLRDHATLRRNMAFPSEILIWSAAFSRLLEFLIEIGLVMVGLMVFHHQGVPTSLVLFPLLIVIQIFLIVGLMYPLSTLSVFFHDVSWPTPRRRTVVTVRESTSITSSCGQFQWVRGPACGESERERRVALHGSSIERATST